MNAKVPSAFLVTRTLKVAMLGESAVDAAFDDVVALAAECRFTDCAHNTEPGCAIKVALADGSLEVARFNSYRKLQRELRAIAAKSDARIRIEERRKWKQIAMAGKTRARP